MGVNEARGVYGIPSPTLYSRIKQNSMKGLKQIRRLEASGLSSDRSGLKTLAYSLNVKVWLQGKFNKDKKVEDYD